MTVLLIRFHMARSAQRLESIRVGIVRVMAL
jgi:hypothetical protein